MTEAFVAKPSGKAREMDYIAALDRIRELEAERGGPFSKRAHCPVCGASFRWTGQDVEECWNCTLAREAREREAE